MSSQRYSFTDKSNSPLNINLLYLSSSKHEYEQNAPLHTHHFTEIYYITGGNGVFQVDNQKFPVKENNLIIINPHIVHGEFPSENSCLEYVSLGFEGMTFNFASPYKTTNFGLFDCEKTKDKIIDLLDMLTLEAEAEDLSHNIVCQNLAEILIIYILRLQNLTLNPSFDTKMSKECGTAKRYIDSNYMENITLDMLAELTHMNKFYLVHSFTKFTGLSPINYLTQKRIRVAMEYLESTDYSIAQIATIVGFSSQSYFSQVFRKTKGITPAQYRKQQVKKISPLE